ncbi:hypothetical protein [Anaplasma capra]|uniref:hypothetical protein n=1 Tax=Anaplasma capra TaxID=1562740 RepID=UPI0021D5C3F7|nr:hypothetical protein [Anaplasma capra]MCU7611152.1 hypothetical protein [Anaplasma capra]MCU7612344.1 hypothetical protein [Anaplasma capra]
MIYFDSGSAENAHGGSVYIHSDQRIVTDNGGNAAEHRIDHFCPATFTYNKDGTMHFLAGGAFKNPEHSILSNFVVTGDFEYINHYDAQLNNVAYLECKYSWGEGGPANVGNVLSRYSAESLAPVDGHIAFDDRRTIVFQSPEVVELILRVPSDMRSQHDFVILEPPAC